VPPAELGRAACRGAVRLHPARSSCRSLGAGAPDRGQRLRCRKEQHDLHARNRTPYGITDGQAYQDLDNPGAAAFHIRADDIDTAMAWFRSDTMKHPS